VFLLLTGIVRARGLFLSLSLVSNQRPDRQTDDDDEEQKGKRERREKSGLCVSVYLFLWYLLIVDCGVLME